MRFRDVDAVGFDLDGTLFDHPAAAADAADALIGRLGAATTPELIELWFTAEDRHYDRWLAGEIDYREQRRARVRDLAVALELTPSDADVDALIAGYLIDYRAGWRVYPEVLQTLDRLREEGCRIGILTNGLGAQQRDKLAVTGLDAYADAICVSEEIGAAKPEAAAFGALVRALDVRPARLVFVGDNPHADVAGARAAGIRAAQVRSRGREIAGLASAVRRAAASHAGVPPRAL